MDLLLFACFTFIVMVSFKEAYVVCLFILDGYGVVQWISCCLLVFLRKNKRSLGRHHNHQGKTSKQQKLP
jgi:hypothetical protein